MVRSIDSALRRADSPNSANLIGPDGEEIPLPETVFRLLSNVVRDLAQGHAVSIVPVHAQLTTQDAADLLNISRPFLIKLLDKQELPYHRVGTHRRIRFGDLMAYRERRAADRRKSLDRLAHMSQEYGLYDE